MHPYSVRITMGEGEPLHVEAESERALCLHASSLMQQLHDQDVPFTIEVVRPNSAERAAVLAHLLDAKLEIENERKVGGQDPT